MEVVLLAGGQGSRLKELFPDLAKPLVPVGGEPFLRKLLREWIRRGARSITLSLGYRADQIRENVGDRFEGVPISYAVEASPLGTGGALARGFLSMGPRSEAVWVANADTWVEFDPAQVKARHSASGADLTLLAVKDAELAGSHLSVDADGWLTEISRKSAPARGLVHAGVYLFSTRAIRELAEEKRAPLSMEDEILPQWSGGGKKIAVAGVAGPLLDLGTPEGLRRMESHFSRGPR